MQGKFPLLLDVGNQYEIKPRKMDMRADTWNVRSLHKAGSLMTIATGLVKYKIDSAGVQEPRRERGGAVSAGLYIYIYIYMKTE
jgi:hypothetical protein